MTTELAQPKAAPLAKPVSVGDDLAQLLSKGKELGLNTPEELGKLVDVYERIADRNARQAFNQALAEFQADCPPIEKTRPVFDRQGGHMYNYANLHDLLNVARPLMVKHGLSASWTVRPEGQTPFVVCILKHVAGHSEEHAFPFSPDAGAMTELQRRGSGLSYAKRYTLCEALGIDLDDDRDGQPDKPQEPIAESEIASLRDAVISLAPPSDPEGKKTLAAFCKRFGVKTLAELPAAKVDDAWAMVKAKQ